MANNTSVQFAFDTRDEAAQKAAADHAAALITNISDETRAGVRALVVRSIRDGIPPLDAAKLIRSQIGMNAPQALAAANYRDELTQQGLSSDRIDRAMEFYAAKKVRDRADTIARTEVLGALNAGAQASWQQAMRRGLMGRGARKIFITTPDEILCKQCAPMNKQSQPINKPFVTPSGKHIMYPPVHPRCRCTMGDPSMVPRIPTLPGDVLDAAYPGLAKGRIIDRVILGGGHVTKVFDVKILDLGRIIRAIAKPADKGWVTDEFIDSKMIGPETDTAAREVLASSVGKLLGVPGLVPTVGRTLTYGAKKFATSLGERVDDTIQLGSLIGKWSYLRWTNRLGDVIRFSDDQLLGISVWDMITGNFDRHSGNILAVIPGISTAQGSGATPGWWHPITEAVKGVIRLHPIDHGYSFPQMTKKLEDLLPNGLTAPNDPHQNFVFGKSALLPWLHSISWPPPGFVFPPNAAPAYQLFSSWEHAQLRNLEPALISTWAQKVIGARESIASIVENSTLTDIEKEGALRRLRTVVGSLTSAGADAFLKYYKEFFHVFI